MLSWLITTYQQKSDESSSLSLSSLFGVRVGAEKPSLGARSMKSRCLHIFFRRRWLDERSESEMKKRWLRLVPEGVRAR
jgi:hypothetical protein